MTRIYRLICTCLGIGYVPKGGGSIAAAVCGLAWYLAWRNEIKPFWLPLLITVALLLVGVYGAGKVERDWGKDSYRIVIDEVAGMCLTLLFVPVRWPYVVAGFLLFRFFDIAKPLYIRKMEKLNGGWGVMMDDVLAGVYANLLLQFAIFANSFVKTP